MPVGAFVPSRIHLDYPEWQAPLIGNIGQVWAYDGTGYAPVALDFDPAGTAAAAVAAHVALSNPHSQYFLASGVSGFGATLASAADAAAARTALALGTAALYNVGTSANNIVQLDGSARLPAVDGSQVTGITVAAAGSNTQVIINDGGVYAGDPGLTYAKATGRLTVAGGLVAPSMRPASNGTSALGWFDASGTQFVYGDTTNKRVGIGAAPTSNVFEVSSAGVGIAKFTRTSSAHAIIEFGNTVGTFFFGTTAGVADFGIGLTTNLASNAFFTIARSGYVGITTLAPTALLDLAASTTARASLRIRSGTAPTTPNAGDIWYPTGGRLNVYRAATETIASGVPGSGGAATATGTWGATEQAMLQAIYDAGRAFGMIS